MDKIAERVGALDSTAERTVQTAAQRSFLEPYRLGVADPAAQIEAVTQALANFGESMRTAIDESESFEDIGTSDMFTEVSRGIDYQLWLVESHRPLQHHNAASRFGRDGRIRIMAGASAAHPN
jgi:starvation-inducible DNA-binding protein